MFLVNDSLTVVLAGDWNKLYIQPDWIASNVFEKEEIEIGVNGQGADFSISYRGDGVIIAPGQSNMIFSVTNTDDNTLSNLCKYLNNFIEKAYTPQLFAYGFNIDFVEEDAIQFAEVLDSMSDTNVIVDAGYEIISTKVNRTLRNGDRIINMDFSLEGNSLKVCFNEHHAMENESANMGLDCIKGFLEECTRIVCELGYELEGGE